MKRLLALLVTLAAGVVIFFLWMARLPPFDGHPPPVEVDLAEVRADMDAVRVRGTAHLARRLTTEWSEGPFRPVRRWWIFPLMPWKDTTSRHIRVIVLTPVEPDPLAAYQDMVVEGWARPPGVAVTPAVRDAFEQAGYTFDENLVVIQAFPPEEQQDGHD